MSEAFPIMGRSGDKRRWVLMQDAQRAYSTYEALGHGSQSLKRLGERGGFGDCEFAYLYNGLDPYSGEKLDTTDCPQCKGRGCVVMSEDGGMLCYCGVCCGAGVVLGAGASKMASTKRAGQDSSECT